ncbi:MAG: UDP-N-acetylmuramate--L-alanine ligase [Lentimicrobiaceae bacterium]|nr:UDP-N-acetylmuramate--L-alanine ligase [Lentimicrobiaceae bacterium]
MTLDKINTIYFLGIGGIGMSALARFFLLQGKQVFGYDLTPTEITSQLTAAGAQIHYEEAINQIPEGVDVVIYTPAVPKEHKEYQYFVQQKTPILKRSEVLGMICSHYPTIAIAGTHGKTTTTAAVTQILGDEMSTTSHSSPLIPDEAEGRKQKPEGGILAFIGGIAKNFVTNFVCDNGFNTVVVEADEFDRSFLTLHPQVAIITSMDADHLDIYGDHQHLKESFQLFANQIQPDGALIIYDQIAHQITHPHKITYGFSPQSHYQITNLQHFPTQTTFTLALNHLPIATNHLSLTTNLPGTHNTLNAVAALAATLEFSLWKNPKADIAQLFEHIKEKIAGFSGVKRRFDIRIQRDDFVYIDDYAHHPEEIRAFLDAVKKSFPAKKLTGIFQPHLYSRTRDFAKEFAHALDVLDEIILLDIYPAREQPIAGITSHFLLSLIKNENKKLLKKEELLPYIQKNKPEVLLTMGAGDIDRCVEMFESI